MVQDGPRFQNGQRCLKHWKKYILQTYSLSAEGAKAGRKKGNIRPSSPFPWFNLFSVFFSFLSVQIFPCGQVDKLFQMSHGAISPSLMVLFFMRAYRSPSSFCLNDLVNRTCGVLFSTDVAAMGVHFPGLCIGVSLGNYFWAAKNLKIFWNCSICRCCQHSVEIAAN